MGFQATRLVKIFCRLCKGGRSELEFDSKKLFFNCQDSNSTSWKWHCRILQVLQYSTHCRKNAPGRGARFLILRDRGPVEFRSARNNERETPVQKSCLDSVGSAL
jgi:hypothetical protein